MKIELVDTYNRGIAYQEMIMLKSWDYCDLSRYILLQTQYVSPNLVSSAVANTFWFPSTEVAIGDTIIIYTKSGKAYSNLTDPNNRVFYFFWNLNKTILNSKKDCITLQEVNDWVTSHYIP